MLRSGLRVLRPSNTKLVSTNLVNRRGLCAPVATTTTSTIYNNMRVATESKPGQTAAVAVFVNTGSMYEDQYNNGVAHFLEHLAFKGTSNRSRRSLEIEIENMGASLNAYTSREHTVYIIKAFKNDIPQAVDILSDIIQHSEYRHEDIHYERGVVLREMEEVNKQVEELAMDHLHALAFQGSPLGYTILGPEENIRSFDRRQILEYTRTHYTADRMLVVGAGAVEHEHLSQLVADKFSALPHSSNLGELEKPVFHGAVEIVEKNVNKDNYCVVAYEGASWSDKHAIPLLIVQTLVGNYNRAFGLGTNFVSSLSRVMSTHNLCDRFSSFITNYNVTGLVGVAISGKGRASLDDALCEVVSEYVRLAHSAGEEEVERAKTRLKTSLALSTDGFTPVCEDIGRQVLTVGRRVTLEEYFERIDAIDYHAIRDVCAQHFVDTKPAVVAVGKPGSISLPDYSTICDWTKW